MKALVQQKERAIEFRKKGLSYREILERVPVAKSSLSLWLSDLPLTVNEKNYLKSRKDSNISRGRIRAASTNRMHRLERERELLLVARDEFSKYRDQILFHVGVALYWAEGSKRSSQFQFTNSDPAMVNIMLDWIDRYVVGMSRQEVGLRLYVHKPYAHERCEEYWSKMLDVSLLNFKKTIYKPSGLGVKKRPNYKGCIRIEMPRSITYLRKMQFWQNMLVEYYKKR